MALTVCGSCDKCYSESAPACRHCGKTLAQQIDDDVSKLKLMQAELKGYERGVHEGVKAGVEAGLAQRIYNFFFIW